MVRNVSFGCSLSKYIRVGLFAFLIGGAQVAAQTQLNSNLLSEFKWRLVGPSSPAGRVWQVVGDERNPKTFYVCTAGGGLWKSTDNGTTLIPVFENQTSASTGAVAIAPSNSDIVWVGTGEPANTRANSWGDGVYKSTDAGKTWMHMGLPDSRQIAAIVIHPTRPDIVYVAAMGYEWGRNSERGIFKTTDGGKSWNKILFINDTTGFIDLQADPKNPEVLYAAAWQRFRFGGGDMAESGPESGLYKTIDGGRKWTKLTNGLPAEDKSKITIAVARNNSRIVYAAILTGEPAPGGKRTIETGGIFRSIDGGKQWQRMNPTMTSYYYDRINVDPGDDNRIWMPVFDLMMSTDGGKTLVKANMKHVHNDQHGIWIDPKDPEHLIMGGDGGVNISYNRGATWHQAVLPIAQFYEVAVDTQDPYYVYGGMQDTGHWLGPSQTYDNEGITNHDWIKLRFNGDGMSIHADTEDPNVIYMVQEFGNFSRLDLRTWDRKELLPDPDEAKKRGLHPFRYDWTPPMIISQHDPHVLYLGSNYLFKFTNRGDKWEVISPDLTAQQDQTLKGNKSDYTGYHSYGALFSIAESPLDSKVIWTGADDGPIYVTRNGGSSWTNVTENFPPGGPTYAVVGEIEASRFDKATAYVAYDAHMREDHKPYLYATNDYGKSWLSITGDLPPGGSSYVIREDPINPDLLFVGTESGVYLTIDRGRHWVQLKNNLPTVAVRAMAIQAREHELVLGTFGRAIWITDIGPIEQLNARVLAKPAHLFDVKPGTLFKTRYTYGATIEELNGDMFFRAENPPFGTAITYYLREAAGHDVNLIIKDQNGKTVRSLTGPGAAGIQRVVWDLKRQDKVTDEDAKRARVETLSERDALGWVAPGDYTVTLDFGGSSLKREINVRREQPGLKRVDVRK
ncbi:MAG TPA: hypothetical protein VGN90_06680 [Pyrinomonadaceae bacterium]|nr:hypothetical protein [Pyrinomonadaceae bacterium]